MKSASTATLVSLLTLAGCTALGPQYAEPDVRDVLNESSVDGDAADADVAPEGQAVPELDCWWQRFGDPALDEMLRMAFRNNRSLEASRANLEASRAAYRYQEGALWPTADIGGDLTRSRTSENGLSGRNRYTDYALTASASWEIDFFGQTKFLADAAAAEAEAAEADLRAAWISVSSEVATRYLELRTLQARLTVAEANLRTQQETYDQARERYEQGLDDALPFYQAEYNLRTTEATIPNLQTQIVACENALAVLCGVTPGTLPPEVTARLQAADERKNPAETGEVIILPSGIPQPDPIDLSEGIPADAIRHRPDVMAAERLLKASSDYLGSAEAEHYPRVYISGDLGLESLHISDLFDWDSHLYRFGPGISLPIFRGGQICANIQIRTEQQRAALATYEDTVLQALAEVRDALSDYRMETDRQTILRQAVASATNAYIVAYRKWQEGLIDFNSVLDAQRYMLALDESRVISEGDIANAQVRLFRSLCGSWDARTVEERELEAYFFGDPSAAVPLLTDAAAE